MGGLNMVFLSSLFLAYLVSPSTYTYAAFITHHCSSKTPLDDPSFQTALVDTFSHLASSSSTSKSNHSTSKGVGGGGQIHASFHCWRRTPSQMACKKCVKSATRSVLRLCPGQQNGTVWNTGCTLHYYYYYYKLDDNNQENVPWVYWYSLSKINQTQFHESLAEFMSGLIDKATDSTGLHASGEVMVTVFDTLYATVECSRPSTCKACLRAAEERLSGCCGGSTAAEVVLPSCRLGYDVGPSTSLVGPLSSASFSRVALKSVATS